MLKDWRELVLSEVRGDDLSLEAGLKSKTAFSFQDKEVTFTISF